MATQTTTLSCSASALLRSDTPSANYHGTETFRLVAYHAFSAYQRALLLRFDALPDSLKYNKIYRVNFEYTYTRSLSSSYYGTIETIIEPFDESTVTWYSFRDESLNFPTGVKFRSSSFDSGTGIGTFSNDLYVTGHTMSYAGVKTLNSDGLILRSDGVSRSGDYADVYGSVSNSRPVLTVYYDTEVVKSQISMVNSPTSGYVNARKSNRFTWIYAKAADEQHECMAESFPQTGATFYWREGTSGAWTSVQVAGSTQQILIPAGTFPIGSSIQYYVEGTDEAGTTSTTATYTLSTTAAPAVATPVSPIGTVEDGSAAIALRWTTASDDGFPQDGADLQISRDGSTWTDLGSVTGTVTQYTAAAGSFLGGTAYWRVRAYNIDGTAGPWSQAATFIVVAAPPAPIVTAEAVPFAVVNWQADGQQAWRVTVDDTVYGPYFGTGKSFTLPDYLQDGEHTAQVEVQGSYGLWSQAGEVTFTVTNVPGDAIQLSGVFYRDAQLSWETESETADFLVYRDGVRIGHTSGSSWTDRVTLGRHSWQVINRLPGGFYTASNVVQGALCTGELAIALLTGGEWLELTKSRNPTRQENYTLTQTISLRHFAGQEYPEAETSPYKTLQVSFDVSWGKNEEEQALLFESMIGKPIIYKAPRGEAMVGIMTAISKNDVSFFRAYAATVQRINWRDFVDEDR